MMQIKNDINGIPTTIWSCTTLKRVYKKAFFHVSFPPCLKSHMCLFFVLGLFFAFLLSGLHACSEKTVV